ncbi:hypothetical protein BX616_001574 [Lobosporangium transversale]|uniref:RRM Nup35-type domain-containing protein n=1 Tax=Lobosporangium transversale TaxID=64571 RepID=A0A1Y2GF51_9FUNG|nr:hypothetical protein BCR41DRAFT_424292 [Lobosporangium transversale]KAF9903616.1 hypothetical protein BX616_001574 [Lobosporangium transversale]ORZ09099.1 hypothetical protein BCR41DRAFT_424292 [Lobosporangium transversale]|eukprot:XP_021878726.1 hypothetical protein BCR41DRAFT_424292 [Lobosporangium transversale]
MFTFNVSGSSSHGRSSQGSSSKASNYVPSAYIAKKLALEEEARRKGGQGSDGGEDSSLHLSLSLTNGGRSHHWPTRDEVLAPGYSSGPLGYDPPSSRTLQQQQLLDESIRLQEEAAAIHRPDASNTSMGTSKIQSDLPSLRTTAPGSTLADSTTTSDQPSFGPKSILRIDRPELNKEDLQKRNASVRFSAVIPEVSTPGPQSPSIFNQNGASPFFGNSSNSGNSGAGSGGSGGAASHLSSSGSMASLHSVLKEDGKVNVLTHRGAAGSSGLNSSLGPALGSVSGTAQSFQAYTPRSMTGELSSPSMRGNTISASGATSSSATATGAGAGTVSGSSFFVNLDGSTSRQGNMLGVSNTFGKAPKDEDEEEKDKERYLPAILLGTGSVLKGSKIEPFMDGNNGKTEWDSDPFHQQSGPSRDTRLAPNLIGEDAPPADTLYDLAQKEKYYSQPTATLSHFSSPYQYSRSTSDTGLLNDSAASTSLSSASSATADHSYDAIITYGFPPEAASYMLNQFRAFGTIVRYESGIYGRVLSESFNWLKIQYEGTWAARNATSRHLRAVGKFVVGVHACRSFSTTSPRSSQSMAMDITTAPSSELESRDIAKDLTPAEVREVEAGVDTLLKIRAQGLGPDLPLQGKAAQFAAANTRARHASLYESWNQGSAGAGASTALFQSIDNITGGSSSSTAGGARNSSVVAVDQEDEDMLHVLGHSLTSSGTLLRSSRLGREPSELLRSTRSQDGSKSDMDGIKRNGMVDGGILSEGQMVENESVGFRPLFGRYEARGLHPNGSGFGQDAQHFQQQQQQQQQRLLEQRANHDAWLRSSNQHRLSLRRPTFGESASSDPTLFASSGGMLLDSSTGTNSASSPFQAQKKQRLSSSLYSSTFSTSSAPSSPSLSNHAPLSQFGRGRDRSSMLVDDPSLVSQNGEPLLKTSQSTSSTPALSTATSVVGGSATGSSIRPTTATTSTASTEASSSSSTSTMTAPAPSAAPESMLSSVLNMTKKRLFWG